MSDEIPYEDATINTWDDLNVLWNAFHTSQKQWIFRGQEDSQWGLETKLERVASNLSISAQDIYRLEGGLLRRFKRHYHLYTSSVLPGDQDYLEWFSLMQHHGAPTRLLDWTYSFFVAVYFALENAKGECAVWALKSDALKKPGEIILNEVKERGDAKPWEAWSKDSDITRPETFKELFVRKKPISFVAAVNPYRLNQRLVIQKGVFTCPGDVSKPFKDNLIEVLQRCPDPKDNFLKLTIINDLSLKKDILQRLDRMNITSATLFPGLDGFAKSLQTAAAFPNILTPDDDWPTETS